MAGMPLWRDFRQCRRGRRRNPATTSTSARFSPTSVSNATVRIPPNAKGDLRLDVREEAIKAKAIVPGNPKASEMIARIHEKDPDEVMPPPDSPRQLTDSDREILARWIEQGAEYEPHWAFTPLPASVPVPDEMPVAKTRSTASSSPGSTREELAPTPPASPERWLRRAAFDLTGLPPSRAELDAFLADKSPDARGRAVDRLLASPRYGEKMAVGWLDVARYADSFGYQSDIDTHAWPYRDWVIGAFNDNLPWDQFITWQIAGDLLPNPTREQITATAFNRLHRKTQEGGSVEAEFRQEGISDRVHTFGTAFLALTFECTRCHDHKYDPLTMQDYYSMGAFFNSIDEWGLLHGVGSIQPNPSQLLTTPEQDQTIARQTAAIAAVENSLAAKTQEREPAFQAWLAKPDRRIRRPQRLLRSRRLGKRRLHQHRRSQTPGEIGCQKHPRPRLTAARRFPSPATIRWTSGNTASTTRRIPCPWPSGSSPASHAPRQLVFHNSAGYDPGYNGFELLHRGRPPPLDGRPRVAGQLHRRPWQGRGSRPGVDPRRRELTTARPGLTD